MFLRFHIATVAVLVLLCGPRFDKVSGVGPPFKEVMMFEERTGPDPSPNPAGGNMRAITISLKDLPDPRHHQDDWGHRFDYSEASLSDVLESLRHEKQLDPVLVFKGEDGKWRLITGHRRIASMFTLAEKGVPGFTLDLPVQANQLLHATPQDLLVRSIADNELGKRLEPKERLMATQKMHQANVPRKRAALALGISEKSYARDVRIVEHERVLDHVLKDHIPPTAASALVEIAGAKGRLDEFLGHFDGWVRVWKASLEEQDRRAKAETGKGLKPSAMLIMNHLEPSIVRGWLDALAKGKPLTEEADLGFEAVFDKKTAKASIRVKIDARNDPVEHLARVAAQISQVAKHLAAFAQKRHELEAPEGPQAALQEDDDFLDKNLLRQFKLEDVALQYTQEPRGPEPTWASPVGMTDITDDSASTGT